MKYNLVAYYTRDTGYEQEVNNLRFSADILNIPIYIKDIPNLGSWQKNTQYKPHFLKACLEEFKTPIVYVDADAVIHQYPHLFDIINGDIGVHYRYDQELLTGTMYLNYNDNVLRLLDAWIKAFKKWPDTWEQRVLEKLLDVTSGWLKIISVYRLPVTYCQIFDSLKERGSPVIEHFQASRRYKKIIDKGCKINEKL